MKITDLPIDERPREKLLALGPAALTDAELLAIFLRTGTPGRSALQLARDLLIEFGGMRPLLQAELSEFRHHRGFGTAKYAQLQASLEITRRYLTEQLETTNVLKNSQCLQRFLLQQLQYQHREVFACLFLDAQMQLIQFEELFLGCIKNISIHPRIVVQRALELNASTVVLAHNHPSGHLIPSNADLATTEMLSKALGFVDILLVDHIIVGKGKTFSLAENGYFQPLIP